jgi:diguanylate cyclase (GGDEF)-like protein
MSIESASLHAAAGRADAQDPRRRAARAAAWLFAVAGVLAITQSLVFAQAQAINRFVLLGLLDLAVAALLVALPWQRWPARALTVVIPIALGVIPMFGIFGEGMPLEVLSAFYLVLMVWAGLSLPRFTVLKASPLLFVAYMAPYIHQGRTVEALGPAITHGVMIVLVGEIVARVVDELHRARADSERRAQTLRAIMLASQGFNTLQSSEVLARVVPCVRDLGFDAAALSVIDAEHGVYRLMHVSGFPDSYVGDEHSLERGITGMAWRDPRTIVVHNYQTHPMAVPSLAGSGFDFVVAAPVKVDGAVRAVLIGARRSSDALGVEVRDAFELLAAHAGVALKNAHDFEAGEERARLLLQRALRDELTGLGNRRFAETLLQGVQPGDAVLMLDLDHFKQVNDQDGHAAGDALLRALGRFLQQSVREGDRAARYGGEEFVVVVPAADGSAEQIADRLIADWRACRPRTTMSIGWAVARPDEDGHATLARADAALYRSKRGGRDRASGENGLPAGQAAQSLDR